METYAILGKRDRRQPVSADVARPQPQLLEHMRGWARGWVFGGLARPRGQCERGRAMSVALR
eukprot:1301380-Alexandrium_andersonii.AAC.1